MRVSVSGCEKRASDHGCDVLMVSKHKEHFRAYPCYSSSLLCLFLSRLAAAPSNSRQERLTLSSANQGIVGELLFNHSQGRLLKILLVASEVLLLTKVGLVALHTGDLRVSVVGLSPYGSAEALTPRTLSESIAALLRPNLWTLSAKPFPAEKKNIQGMVPRQ